MISRIHRARACLARIGLLALLSLCPLSALGADYMDWTQYRGPNRDGVSSEAGWLCEWPPEGPRQLWKTSIGTGFASMAVVGGRVYAFGHDEQAGLDSVFCLDAETGQEIWKHAYPCEIRDKQHEGGPCGTPAVAGKKVLTISKMADFHCLDAETGKVVWYKDLKKELGAKVPSWSFSGSPLILNQLVIIDVGRIAAFDIVTGDLVWKTKDYGAAYSSPVAFDLGNRKGLAVFPEIGLVVLDAKDGKEIARHAWETSFGVNAATPIVLGNKIFLSSGYNRGCTLLELGSGRSPNVLWENTNMRNHFNTSVYHEGHFYGFDDNKLACLDETTGGVKWTRDGMGKGSLTLADGKLIILSDKGELVIANAAPSAYEELSRAQILGGKCWTVPVLSGHRVYARNARGDLVCIDLRKG